MGTYHQDHRGGRVTVKREEYSISWRTGVRRYDGWRLAVEYPDGKSRKGARYATFVRAMSAGLQSLNDWRPVS